MRIAILTQELLQNYGGVLQAYALQKVLRRLGHDTVTIDYFPRMTVWYYCMSQIKTLLYYIAFYRSRKFFRFPRKERCPEFAGFISKRIVLTKHFNNYKVSTLKNYKIEALVVGSDQVWRKLFHSDSVQKDLFLRFAKKLSIPKVAYAASFGTDKWEFSEKLTRKCAKYAKLFTAISVRETSGVDLCHKYLNIDAVQMPDPTLLLNKEDYAELCKEVKGATVPFLLAYILDIDNEKRAYITKIADNMGLNVYFCTADSDISLSVEQWLAMFRDASFVITNSFHGTVFSIINNKDFYSIVNEWRGTDRFVSLLSHFDLLNRLYNDVDSLPTEITHMDWDKVNEIKNKWQKTGYDFLQAYLK